VGSTVVRVVEVLSVATCLLGIEGGSLICSKIKDADEGKVKVRKTQEGGGG